MGNETLKRSWQQSDDLPWNQCKNKMLIQLNAGTEWVFFLREKNG